MVTKIIPLLPSTEVALNLLETLLDKSFDAILITDGAKDQKIIYCNAAFERLTGYTAEEMIGKSPKLLQGPSTDRIETERLGRCLLAGILYRAGSQLQEEWHTIYDVVEGGSSSNWK